MVRVATYIFIYLVVVALATVTCRSAWATRINIYTDTRTSDPSCPGAGNGAIWYRSDTDKWRKCEGAAATDLDTGGGGGGDNAQVEDGDNAGTFTAMVDANFDDSGDINFVRAAGPPDVVTGEIRAGAVGTTEAAALDAGDITTGTLADGLVNGANEENEIDLVDLADSADACAASQGVRRNAGDAAFECFTFPADDDVPEAGDFGALSATLPITQSGGTISTSMTTNRLIGRTTASTGVMEEITVGSPLTLSGLALDVTNIATADLAEGVELANLLNNCVIENDSTPIPDACVGDGSDAGGAGGGLSYAEVAAANLAGF